VTITDTQIREVVAGLVAVVEREREGLFDSNKVLAEDAPDCGTVTDPEIATDIALMDALVAGGKVVVEELDRRAAELARLHAVGGALA
jgi:hypothetical protein